MLPFQVSVGHHLASCESRIGRVPLRASRLPSPSPGAAGGGLPRHLESDWARGPASSETDVPAGAGPYIRSGRYELLSVATLRRARVVWAGSRSRACRPLSPLPGVSRSWYFRVGLGHGLGRARVLLPCRRRPERPMLTFQVTAGRHPDACVSRVGRVPLTGLLAPGPLPRGPTPPARPGRVEPGAWPGCRTTLGSGPRPHVTGTAGRSHVAACGTACGSDPAPSRNRGRLSVRGRSAGDRPSRGREDLLRAAESAPWLTGRQCPSGRVSSPVAHGPSVCHLAPTVSSPRAIRVSSPEHTGSQFPDV